MGSKILVGLFGVGAAVFAFAAQAGAEDGRDIPREKRGMMLGTMVYLKSVKLQEAPAFPAYIVNNDNVLRADPETAKFIAELLSNCLPDFWER